MSYCEKLTGEDSSRYLNKIESLALRKAQRQIGDLAVNAVKCLHFFAFHHDGQNSWHR